MTNASSLFPTKAAIRDANLAVAKLLDEQKSSYRDLLEAAPEGMVVVTRAATSFY